MDLLNRLRCAALAVACIGAVAPRAAMAQETLEPAVKATFLYNFTRFIEWPDPTAANATPFRLCVVADASIEQAIQRTIEGEFVHGRPLVMTKPRTPQEAETCQILFVGRSEQEQAAALLAAVRDRPVLTVGDSALFIESGGAIQFVLIENRIRFDVNLPSAHRANLKFNANLLRVARKVNK